jgi:hypothetical protein
LRYVASESKGDYVQEILSTGSIESNKDLIITFDTLVKSRKFIKLVRTALRRLEEAYKTPVDIEFTVEIVPNFPEADFRLHILQCRPLSQREIDEPVSIPDDIAEEDVLFRTRGLIPDGSVDGVRYVVFVNPIRYRQIDSPTRRLEVGRAIGRLNKILEDERFILVGPGRWGSANIELGVRVTYADIFNTKVLIEMSVAGKDGVPELSYGTHFFQDLVEGGIHSLPLHLHGPDSRFDWDFFDRAPNALGALSPPDADLADYLKVVDIAAVDPNQRLTIVMDGASDEAVGYFEEGDWQLDQPQGTVSVF